MRVINYDLLIKEQEKKLKRCPCCGSYKVKFTTLSLTSDGVCGYVSCQNCKLTQSELDEKEIKEAIKLWNTRYLTREEINKVKKK